jgi:hypothetical protein
MSLEVLMLRRIDTIQWRTQHTNWKSTRCKTTMVRRSINAFSKTAHHRPSSTGEAVTKSMCHPTAMIRRSARSHHRDSLLS